MGTRKYKGTHGGIQKGNKLQSTFSLARPSEWTRYRYLP
jgi:hypothetical protein